MAAYTSSGTGFWDLPGTWGGAGVPSAATNDTATIQSNHTVTVRVNSSVGSSLAAGTNALVNNGTLVINSGVTFTVAGDVLMSGTTGTNGQINCAGSWVFDGTTATAKYKCAIGGQHSTTAKMIFSGTSGARASCSSLGSGASNGYFDNATWIGGGRMECDYCDFTRVGDATNFLAKYYVQDVSTHNVFYRNCTFTSCGRIGPATGLTDHANFQVSDCLFQDTKDVNFCLGFTGSSSASTGLRVIRNNRTDRQMNIINLFNAQITDNVFGVGYQAIGGQTGLTWSNNTIINVSVLGGMVAITSMNGDYVFDDSGQNVHSLVVNLQADYSIANLVIDGPRAASGDLIAGGPGAGPLYAMTVTGCIVMRNSAGGNIGELISPTGTGLTYTVDHNTVFADATPVDGESGVAVYGETYAGRAGMYASVRSNLIYSPTGHGTALMRHNQGTASDPLASPSMGDYNAFSSPVSATGGGVVAVYGAIGGYCDVSPTQTVPMFTTTTGLGAHDFICVNPGFIDTTRCMATFDTAYLGNTATAWATATSYAVGDIRSTASSGFYGNATVNFRCVAAHTSASGDATTGQPGVAANWRTNWEFASVYRLRSATPVAYAAGVPQATPQDLSKWVRAGWTPTAAALKGAAHDGGDIGAMAVMLAVSTRGRRNVPRGLGRGFMRGVA